jgi:hypothetical protein
MTRITSGYKQGNQPVDVKMWEAQADRAETDTAALVQLTYHLLLQVRTVKVLLMGTLVVVPLLAVLALLVLLGSGVLSAPS